LTPLAFERDPVEDVHGMHDGFDFVKAVSAFAENVQQLIDFAG
jgi:hypothetical protein